MKLYGALASPYVARVLLFARIKGVDLPQADLPGGRPNSPEYKLFTPIGKIPSLDVDGKCIPESETICEYLEDVYPDKPGLPADPFDRAQSRTSETVPSPYRPAPEKYRPGAGLHGCHTACRNPDRG